MRCFYTLALIGAVSAEWHGFESFGKGKGKGKGKEFEGDPQPLPPFPAENLGKGKGKGKPMAGMPPEIMAEIIDAHTCHRNCGENGDCHEKCPKPWDKLIDACHQLPQLKACYEKCRISQEEDWNGLSQDCVKTCPAVRLDWVQKMFEEAPEMTIANGELRCPELEKRHACHQDCAPGDFECHGKCHHEHGWHHQHGEMEGEVGHGWHRHGDHDWHHHGEHGSHHGQHNWKKHGEQEFQAQWEPEQEASKFQLSAEKIGNYVWETFAIVSDNVMELISDLRSYHQPDGKAKSVVV